MRIDPASDLAAPPYSSGTTGLPKGVELTHANVVAQARQVQPVLRLTEADVVVGVAPFFHAIGQNLILPCSLRAGATVVTIRVAPYKRLRGVHFVDQVPRSPTGKLLRRVLVEAERAGAA